MTLLQNNFNYYLAVASCYTLEPFDFGITQADMNTGVMNTLLETARYWPPLPCLIDT